MPPPSVDTVSSLPDEILCSILSLLPTKESVATTLLSKRWTHLCHRVPDLHFTDITESNIDSLYSFLLSRDTADSNYISIFNLDIQFSHSFDFHSITKCVDFVVQTRLRLKFLRLHLHHECNKVLRPQLPFTIFTCKTLTSLSLYWFHTDGYSFSSNTCQLPLLKILRLELINFVKIRDFMLFLAGSPILEDLTAFHIYFDFFRDDSSHTSPEFKSLTWPNLTRLNLSPFCGSSWFMFMVNALSTSVFLSIETNSLYIEDHIVSKINQQCLDDIPMFHNLTHLELHSHWELVLKVLHLCPNLQNLQLSQASKQARWNDKNYLEIFKKPQFVPKCLSLSLTTCAMRDFLGLQGDLMLAKYILKNAKYLQTMSISSLTELPGIERKLFACPMASTTCRLSIIHNKD
ncbi:FBD-associated F-box protein At5g56370-like [Vicia villosa]|uniref:FBD-associated F-box protein At5g56370-like n=1 Tax=Vicia villosa TaxID=3911 RepID=UPI00273CC834|nr:FBD-associated F-box protein At5g56370-like [Vicia villosa]